MPELPSGTVTFLFTELEGSHAIMLSQPQAVADVILTAVAAVS